MSRTSAIPIGAGAFVALLKWRAMRRSTVGVCLAISTLAGLLGVSPALAARPVLPSAQGGPHVVVHYALPPDPAGITDATAATVLAQAERAWSVIVDQWGWQPLPDGALGGDARIDYYVTTLPPSLNGQTFASFAQPQSPAYVLVDKDRGTNLRTIAHELLHVGQNALARPAETWLKEGTADWAGRAIAADPTDRAYEPRVPLDCLDADPVNGCGRGYRTQPFFKYLADRFGVPVIRAIFGQWPGLAAGPQPGLHAIDGALAAVGSSLSAGFGEFATQYAARGPVPTATVATGGAQTLAPVTMAVDHLAARYVRYTAVANGTCRPAVLHLAVTVPAGESAAPSFWSAADGRVVTLQGAGPVSADIDWNTCGARGTLVLPNASWTADALPFTVNASLTSTAPPPPNVAPHLRILSVSGWPSTAGRLSVLLRCQTRLTGGCHGAVQLRARVARRTRTLVSRTWVAPTSAAVPLRLQLDRRARRLARAARTLRLDVVARDAGPKPASAHRHLRRP